MDKNKERLQRISGELRSMNLEYERFPAINGKTLSDSEIAVKTSLFSRTFVFTHAAIGCALSHLTLWKKAAAMPDDFVCIMEDDATFTEKFPIVLKDIPKIYSKTPFDIMQLYGEFLAFGKSIHKTSDYNIIKPVFDLSLCCYVISREGAKKLVELTTKLTSNIDFHIARLNLQGLLNQVFLAHPEVVKPSLEVSTINNLNRGGLYNKLICYTPFKEYKKYTNSNVLNFQLVYSISPYLLIIFLFLAVSIFKRRYILAVIIAAEIFMLLKDIEL